MNNYVQPLERETFEEYRLRVYKMKQLGTLKMTWNEIADMFYDFFLDMKDESKWRKEAKELLMSSVEEVTSEQEALSEDLKSLILEYKKERVKLSDERVQNNALIRRMAREDTIIEIAKYAVDKMSAQKILTPYSPHPFLDTNKEGIVTISDWHYGIDIDNFLNRFNPTICRNRVQKLLIER